MEPDGRLAVVYIPAGIAVLAGIALVMIAYYAGIRRGRQGNFDPQREQEGFRAIVAIVVIFCVMAYIAALFFVAIPEANKDMVNFAGGALVGSGFVAVIQFFYGSSQGSKEAANVLAQIAKQQEAKTPETKQAPQADEKPAWTPADRPRPDI